MASSHPITWKFSFTLKSDKKEGENTILLFHSGDTKRVIIRSVALEKLTLVEMNYNEAACWLYWFVTNNGVQLLVGAMQVAKGEAFKQLDGSTSHVRHVVVKTDRKAKKFTSYGTMITKSENRRKEMLKAFKQPEDDFADYYGPVDTPFGEMPILAMAQLTRNVIYDDSKEAFFLQLFKAGCKGKKPKSVDEWAMVLNEVCTFITRNLQYTADLDEYGKPFEQYTCPGWFPDPKKAGFDCEDGAMYMMSLLWVLMHTEFKQKSMSVEDYNDLLALIAFAKNYTACLTFGVLQGKGHAFVTLLDTKFLMGGKATHPSILCESTVYFEGVYSQALLAKKTGGKDPTPVNLNYINYDTISTLLSHDFNGNLAHILVTQGTNIRAKTFDVMTYQTSVTFEVLHQEPGNYFQLHYPPNYLLTL
jgi:hypothetical protein